MTSKSKLLSLALLGAAALPAAATECGAENHNLMAPFAGHWRDDVGDTYDISPGKISQSFTVHTDKGDERRSWKPRLVITDDEKDPNNSLLDCRELTVAERDSLDQVMTGLAEKQNSERAADADYVSHETIALFRTYLTSPPYPMMAATHNGNEQWLVLVKNPDRLIDVFYGENHFKVHVYAK
jgi:hypothetical protein